MDDNLLQDIITILSKHVPNQETMKALVKDLYYNVDSQDEKFSDVAANVYWRVWNLKP